jgi:hypothetical protein
MHSSWFRHFLLRRHSNEGTNTWLKVAWYFDRRITWIKEKTSAVVRVCSFCSGHAVRTVSSPRRTSLSGTLFDPWPWRVQKLREVVRFTVSGLQAVETLWFDVRRFRIRNSSLCASSEDEEWGFLTGFSTPLNRIGWFLLFRTLLFFISITCLLGWSLLLYGKPTQQLMLNMCFTIYGHPCGVFREVNFKSKHASFVPGKTRQGCSASKFQNSIDSRIMLKRPCEWAISWQARCLVVSITKSE